MNEILIRKAKKGDKDAFCRLIDENVQSMYKVLRMQYSIRFFHAMKI